MSRTRVERHIRAPRAAVYAALIDGQAIAAWRAPEGMACRVHHFEPRVGGTLRVSVTYDVPAGAGQKSSRTDTYKGRLVELVPNGKVVEIDAFETDDPDRSGEMTLTITLEDGGDGGTTLTAVHEGLPAGISAIDNETGWRMSLDRLAKLVETR